VAKQVVWNVRVDCSLSVYGLHEKVSIKVRCFKHRSHVSSASGDVFQFQAVMIVVVLTQNRYHLVRY
jgi:hypothetical protein